MGEATPGGSVEFARAINAVYSAYVNRLGIFCWSAVFAFPPIAEGGEVLKLMRRLSNSLTTRGQGKILSLNYPISGKRPKLSIITHCQVDLYLA